MPFRLLHPQLSPPPNTLAGSYKIGKETSRGARPGCAQRLPCRRCHMDVAMVFIEKSDVSVRNMEYHVSSTLSGGLGRFIPCIWTGVQIWPYQVPDDLLPCWEGTLWGGAMESLGGVSRAKLELLTTSVVVTNNEGFMPAAAAHGVLAQTMTINRLVPVARGQQIHCGKRICQHLDTKNVRVSLKGESQVFIFVFSTCSSADRWLSKGLGSVGALSQVPPSLGRGWRENGAHNQRAEALTLGCAAGVRVQALGGARWDGVGRACPAGKSRSPRWSVTPKPLVWLCKRSCGEELSPQREMWERGEGAGGRWSSRSSLEDIGRKLSFVFSLVPCEWFQMS